jgi:large repetitive protein
VVDVDTTATVANTATFTQANPDGSGGNSGTTNTVTLSPASAEVTLVKTVVNADPQQGTNDTYRIAVANMGPDAAPDVVVTDPLPSGMTFVSTSATQGTVSESQSSGRTEVTWDVGSLADGATASLDIVVTITASGGSLTNVADLTTGLYDPTGQSKSATAVATIAAPATVPPVHTGEPWSGAYYWLLVALLGAGGVLVIGVSRRRRYGSD